MQIGGRRTRQGDGTRELQIAASEVLGGEVERPVASLNHRFAVVLCGSVEVYDSAGIFQLGMSRRESAPTECG